MGDRTPWEWDTDAKLEDFPEQWMGMGCMILPRFRLITTLAMLTLRLGEILLLPILEISLFFPFLS